MAVRARLANPRCGALAAQLCGQPLLQLPLDQWSGQMRVDGFALFFLQLGPDVVHGPARPGLGKNEGPLDRRLFVQSNAPFMSVTSEGRFLSFAAARSVGFPTDSRAKMR